MKAVAYDGPDAHHRLIQDAFFRSASGSTFGSNSATMMDRSRQMSVCTCAAKCKGNDSAATTPSARKKSMSEYDEDTILVGREFGFTMDDVGERV
jgi:pheromone alpha factor receptor